MASGHCNESIVNVTYSWAVNNGQWKEQWAVVNGQGRGLDSQRTVWDRRHRQTMFRAYGGLVNT